MQPISAKVYGLVRRGSQILAERIDESDGTLKCYRPLGGTLAFGERSVDGIRREFREELGTDIDVIGLFHVAEEIYTYRGKAGHQIAFVYEITLQDKTVYQQDRVTRSDMDPSVAPDARIRITAEWIDPHNVPHGVPLVPEDLARRLAVR